MNVRGMRRRGARRLAALEKERERKHAELCRCDELVARVERLEAALRHAGTALLTPSGVLDELLDSVAPSDRR